MTCRSPLRYVWDGMKRSINYLEVSKRIEQAGASLLAVHGRTRVQQYKGEVDLDAIAEIKKRKNSRYCKWEYYIAFRHKYGLQKNKRRWNHDRQSSHPQSMDLFWSGSRKRAQ
ncbi:MAG: tRNA-dihydrouridine synthase [Ignavibacteriales bacterium]|nr:tRNA-dihydrouridine synthase [Ignavibacteriales bacterium]